MANKYGPIQEDFFSERSRILSALKEDRYRHLIMRLIGALAFRTHCPQYGYLQDALGREFTDIDFASYSHFFKDISSVLRELGYEEDKMVTRLFSDSRLLFHDPLYGRHIDIFFNQLDFSHVIPLKGRLEVEELTLPLAELVLEKMQIVQINEKDIIDTIMLLREHPVGDNDDETINAGIICKLTSRDWGLWRTASGNLKLVSSELDHYVRLTDEDRQCVRQRIELLLERMEQHPKTFQWKLRNTIGDKVKWYKDVEELMDR